LPIRNQPAYRLSGLYLNPFYGEHFQRPIVSGATSALDSLLKGLQIGSIFRLSGGVGRGKTTVLKEVHKQIGGAFLGMTDFVAAASLKHPLALEETLYNLVLDGFGTTRW
jgi:hypothetical protein